jgi:hypothetical protein
MILILDDFLMEIFLIILYVLKLVVHHLMIIHLNIDINKKTILKEFFYFQYLFHM